MDKALLIRVVADRLFSKHIELSLETVRATLDTLLDVIGEELHEDEDVILKGFGRFTVSERAQRIGRHPVTGDRMVIPARKKVTFMPHSSLKFRG